MFAKVIKRKKEPIKNTSFFKKNALSTTLELGVANEQ